MCLSGAEGNPVKKRYNNVEAFFALLRAGLWEQDVNLLPYGKIDFSAIYNLAEEQSVIGLVAAGLENVVDTKVPQKDALTFVGTALQLEQRNSAMNRFVGELIVKLRAKDIYALLVKGQGIAQCYERPLWRACGDVDLFLNKEDYEKAKSFFSKNASIVEDENTKRQHVAYDIDGWEVELHGTLYGELTDKIDRGLDRIQYEIFVSSNVRSWMNGNTQVFLPNVDCDVIIIFTHFLKHFFRGGIGLRQICDWCRLLWTYRDKLNVRLLEKILREMRLLTEWKAFGALAVDFLGMPMEAMPFYSSSVIWSRKAKHILSIILETGNFGHNLSNSYYNKYPYLVTKAISFWRHTLDGLRLLFIFPVDSLKLWGRMIKMGMAALFESK